MNKINDLFKRKKKNILCIYFTAGYPKMDSTINIIKTLEETSVDLIEIGIPYSDPLADGVIIQKSNEISLKNGMNVSLLFNQLNKIKNINKKPIILMGYFNQFYKYGENKFLENCKYTNVSGLIIPDLPYELYIKKYKSIFEKNSISMIFLITPNTSFSRISILSRITNSFLYIVSSNSTTGKSLLITQKQISFFKKINFIHKNIIKLIGFGIKNKNDFHMMSKYANGCIIGSSFIELLKNCYNGSLSENIKNYINSIYCN